MTKVDRSGGLLPALRGLDLHVRDRGRVAASAVAGVHPVEQARDLVGAEVAEVGAAAVVADGDEERGPVHAVVLGRRDEVGDGGAGGDIGGRGLGEGFRLRRLLRHRPLADEIEEVAERRVLHFEADRQRRHVRLHHCRHADRLEPVDADRELDHHVNEVFEAAGREREDAAELVLLARGLPDGPDDVHHLPVRHPLAAGARALLSLCAQHGALHLEQVGRVAHVLEQLINLAGRVSLIEVQVAQPDQVEAVRSQLQERLGDAYAVTLPAITGNYASGFAQTLQAGLSVLAATLLALGAFLTGIVVGETDLAHRILGDTIPLQTNRSGLVEYTVAGVVWSPGLDVIVGMYDLDRTFDQRTAASVFGTLDDARRDFGVRGYEIFVANVDIGIAREEVLDQLVDKPVTQFDDALSYSGVQHYLQSRREVQRKLSSAGVYSLDCTAKELAMRVANSYLEIKSAGIL